MNPRKFFTNRAIGLIIVIVIFGLYFGFNKLNSYIYSEKQADDSSQTDNSSGADNSDNSQQIDNPNYEPYRATLTGEYVCLPHKDQSGPQTEECAYGLLTDTGEYYAIDFYLMSQSHSEFSTGDRFSATGVITPIERLSTNQWNKYPIKGIFSVTDSVMDLE